MNINEFLEKIVADLHTAHPNVKSASVYPGQFTVNELKTVTTQAPALRLAVSDFSKVAEVTGGEVEYTLGLSLAVITVDAPGAAREKTAVELVQSITQTIAKGELWGCENAHASMPPSARNLYSGDLAKLRVQLWDIRWQQTIRLGDPDWQPEGVMPTTLYVGQSPKIGPGHEDDYEQVGGSRKRHESTTGESYTETQTSLPSYPVRRLPTIPSVTQEIENDLCKFFHGQKEEETDA